MSNLWLISYKFRKEWYDGHRFLTHAMQDAIEIHPVHPVKFLHQEVARYNAWREKPTQGSDQWGQEIMCIYFAMKVDADTVGLTPIELHDLIVGEAET